MPFILKILLAFAAIILMNKNVYPDWLKVQDVSGSSCILPAGNIILVGTNNGIYRSTDDGLSWKNYMVNYDYSVITDLTKNDNFIFAGTLNGVYSSADTGKTWSYLGPEFTILSVCAIDSIIFTCIQGGGLFRSENNGQTWSPIDGNHYYSYLLYNNKIFTGTFTGIYVSPNNGLTWDFAALPNQIITSLSKNDKYFFAANYTYGIYRSEDYGITWSESNSGIPLNYIHPYTVFAKDSLIFAGFTSNKIYLSIDNGLNWKDFSNGINIDEETYHVKFAIYGNKIFASFLYNSLWYYDLSQITNVFESNDFIPGRTEFSLSQNYPNPFNPTTKIKYSIPSTNNPLLGGLPADKAGVRGGLIDVQLKVYDILGREVAILVNEEKKVGYYKVEWDASNQPSGEYFYQIKTAGFTETKKMVLVK